MIAIKPPGTTGSLHNATLLRTIPLYCPRLNAHLYWRFSSHAEHSKLLLAAYLTTGYDFFGKKQATAVAASLCSELWIQETLNVVEIGEAMESEYRGKREIRNV